MASSVGVPSFGGQLYVTDKESKILFLVDKRDNCAPLSAATNGVKHSCPSKLTLRAVNSTLIHTYGDKCMELDLGLWRTYTYIFIVAGVGCTILGAYFLQNFSLPGFKRQGNMPESDWSG